jgi:hypothetical protein
MERKLAQAWLAVALGVMVGCQSASDHHYYSDDPVLLSKKPVDGQPDPSGAPPVLLAHAEPIEPAMPATAVASAPPVTPSTPIAISQPITAAAVSGGTSLADAPSPFKAVPTAMPVTAGPPAQTAVLRRVDGCYGCASDYAWLQGVLDKHYLGFMTLRYCDLATDDRWGGKVILDEDPRLAMFHDGDVVQVEGELVSAAGASADRPWERYPHYRLRAIWLIKHAGE